MQSVKAKRLRMPRPPSTHVYIERKRRGVYVLRAPGDEDDGRKLTLAELSAEFEPLDLPDWLDADIEAEAQRIVAEAQSPADLGIKIGGAGE
jgi:hypothetical protein